MDRRSFAMGAFSALGAARVLGANDRVRMGVIGTGGRGRQVLGFFNQQPDAELVAACDVYEPFLNKALAMKQESCRSYKDYRKLLAEKDVDAVLIATPDHWHALMCIDACRAGKDVYCEKPLSLTIADGRHMVRAARDTSRIVQTGSQQRSGAHYAAARKLIQDGGIGAVHRIHCGYQRNALPGFRPREMADGNTAGFDYDMWLGPAPKRPFDPFRCIYNFRWFWDYSGGQMTNWGAHHLDIARWIVGADAPEAVAGFGGRYEIRDGGETPDVQEVTYQFPKAVLTWTASEVAQGAKGVTLDVYGSKGMLTLTRSGYTVTPERIGNDRTPARDAMQVKGGGLEEAHVRNFLDCVKSRQLPNADVEEGHRSAVMCHLGNISTRLGRSLRWDAKQEQVIGDDEANRRLSRPYRKPWKLDT